MSNKQTNNYFGKRLKEAIRREMKIRQQQLLEKGERDLSIMRLNEQTFLHLEFNKLRIYRAPSTIENWFKGKNEPNELDVFIALRKILQVSVDWLLGLDEDKGQIKSTKEIIAVIDYEEQLLVEMENIQHSLLAITPTGQKFINSQRQPTLKRLIEKNPHVKINFAISDFTDGTTLKSLSRRLGLPEMYIAGVAEAIVQQLSANFSDNIEIRLINSVVTPAYFMADLENSSGRGMVVPMPYKGSRATYEKDYRVVNTSKNINAKLFSKYKAEAHQYWADARLI